MSTLNPGDFPMTGNEEGADLWPLLNRQASAIFTNFANPVRPAEIDDGGSWAREEADGTHTLMLFSAGKDVPVIRSTPTGGASSSFFYTKAQVDQLLATQAAAINAKAEVPIGAILMWAGTTGSIPVGYKLCDGQNGTPDLRDRFIAGAGGAYTVGATGGKDAITDVPAHAHTGSGTSGPAGGHDHGGKTGPATIAFSFDIRKFDSGENTILSASSMTIANGASSETDVKSGTATRLSQRLHYSITQDHTIPAVAAHAHSFAFTTAPAGVASVDIRPRYYALAFIQRKS